MDSFRGVCASFAGRRNLSNLVAFTPSVTRKFSSSSAGRLRTREKCLRRDSVHVHAAKSFVYCCERSTRPSEMKSVVTRRQILVALASLAVARAIPTRAEEVRPATGFVSPSGVRYVDFIEGTGPKPKWGDMLGIEFALYTISPKGDALVMAESTFPDPNWVFFIHHGNGEMILGLEEALHSMRVGGKRRVIIPHNMGYTQPGLGPIPLFAWKRNKFFDNLRATDGNVVIDVQLLSVEKMDDPYGYYSDLVPSPAELTKILQEESKKGIAQGL